MGNPDFSRVDLREGRLQFVAVLERGVPTIPDFMTDTAARFFELCPEVVEVGWGGDEKNVWCTFKAAEDGSPIIEYELAEALAARCGIDF